MLLRMMGMVWSSPNSALGFGFGLLGMVSGGGCQIRRGCLEFHGGWLKQLLARFPSSPAAMTLGHVILGRDRELLDISREHEQVHVRQYCRWGPFFLPAYLSCSLLLWLAGRDAYRDNPFEVQAYNEAG